MWTFSFLSRPRLKDADAELRAELREFSYDGLVALEQDLERDIAFQAYGSPDRIVKYGTWDGCVLSYRRGFAGSVDADRKGRRGNAFTRFWDAERYPTERVRQRIAEELATRRITSVPRPERALVEVR